MNWDMDLNGSPAIFVAHNSTDSLEVKNWHADFKGLLLVDKFNKFNGTPVILGAVVTFSPAVDSAIFSNGNARILYSSAVLSLLPATEWEPRVDFKSWREVY